MFNNFVRKESDDKLISDEGDFLSQLSNILINELEQITDLYTPFSPDQLKKLMPTLTDELNRMYSHSPLKEIFNRNIEKFADYLKKNKEQVETKKNIIIDAINSNFKNIRDGSNCNMMQNNFNIINNIYDDEFVTLINSLSTSIKDFFKHSRACFSVLKSSSDSIVDQILYSKSTISDVLLQLNSSSILNSTGTNAKYSQKNTKEIAGNKDKMIKDKINSLLIKLESINDVRSTIAKNIKSLEQNCAKFYEEAKDIFKKMKKMRNEKLDEYQNMQIIQNTASPNINPNDSNNFYLTSGNFSNFGTINKKNNLTANSSNLNSRYTSNSPSLRIMNNTSGNINRKSNTPNHNLIMIEKEEKIINERIDSFKKRNQDLLSELTETKKSLVDIKFENLCLKEKLEKNVEKLSNKNVDVDKYMSNQNEVIKLLYLNNTQDQSRNKSNSTEVRQKDYTNSYNSSSVGRSKNKFQISLDNSNEIIMNDSRGFRKLSTSGTRTKIGVNDNHQRPPSVEKTEKNKQLCELVLNFIKLLGNLQENISKKTSEVPELKKSFELKKRELCKLAENMYLEGDFQEVVRIKRPNVLNENSEYNENIIEIVRGKRPNVPIINHNNENVIEVVRGKRQNVSKNEESESGVPRVRSVNNILSNTLNTRVTNDSDKENIREEIRLLKDEIENKKNELNLLFTDLEKEKNRNKYLENKMNEEKSINLLFESKLKEEKSKSKETEELQEKFHDLKIENNEIKEKLMSNEVNMKNINLTYEKTLSAIKEEKNNNKKLIESYKNSLKVKEEKFLELTNEYNSIMKEFEIIKVEVNSKNNCIMEYEVQVKNLSELSLNQNEIIESLKNTLSSSKDSQIEQMKEVEQNMQNAIIKLQDKISEDEKILLNYSKIISDYQNELSNALEILKKNENENSDLKNIINSSNSYLDTIHKEKENLKLEVINHEKEYSNLKNIFDSNILNLNIIHQENENLKLKLITCEKEYSELKNKIEKNNSNLDTIHQENENLKLQLNNIQNENSELKNKIEKNNSTLDTIHKENENLKLQLTNIQNENSDFKNIISNSNSNLDAIHKENENLKLQLTNIQKENTDFKNIIHNTNFKLDEIHKENENLKLQVLTHEKGHSDFKKILDSNNSNMDAVQKKNENLKLQIIERDDEISKLKNINDSNNSNLVKVQNENENIKLNLITSEEEISKLKNILEDINLKLVGIDKHNEILNFELLKSDKEILKLKNIIEESNLNQDIIHKENENLKLQLITSVKEYSDLKNMLDSNNSNLGTIHKEKENLKLQLIANENEISDLKNKLECSNSNLITFNKENENLKLQLIARENEISDLKSKLESNNLSLETIQKETLKLQLQLNTSEKGILNLKNILENNDSNLETILKENENLKLKLVRGEKDCSDLKNTVNSNNSNLDKMQKENENLKLQLDTSNYEISDLKNKLDSSNLSLNGMEIEKTKLSQEIDGLKSEIKVLVNSLDNIKEDLNIYKIKTSEIESKLLEEKSKNKELSELISAKDVNINKLTNEISTKETTIDNLNNTNNGLNTSIEKLKYDVLKLEEVIIKKDGVILKKEEELKKILKEKEDKEIECKDLIEIKESFYKKEKCEIVSERDELKLKIKRTTSDMNTLISEKNNFKEFINNKEIEFVNFQNLSNQKILEKNKELEKLSEELEEIKNKYNKLLNSNRISTQELSDLKEMNNRKETEFNNKCNELNDVIKKIGMDLSESNIQKEEYFKQLNEMKLSVENKNQEINILSKEKDNIIPELTNLINNKDEEIKLITKDNLIQLDLLQNEKNNLNIQIETDSKKINNLSDELEKIKKINKESIEIIGELKSENKLIESENSKLIEESKNLKELIEEMNKEKEKLKEDHYNICNKITDELNNEKSSTTELKINLQSIYDTNIQLKSFITELEKECNEIKLLNNKQSEKLNDKELQINLISENLLSNKNDIKNISEQNEIFNVRIKDLQDEIEINSKEKLFQDSELEKLKNKLKEAESIVKESEKHFKDVLELKEQDILNLQSEKVQMNEKYNLNLCEINQLTEQNSKKNIKIDQLISDKNQIEDMYEFLKIQLEEKNPKDPERNDGELKKLNDEIIILKQDNLNLTATNSSIIEENKNFENSYKEIQTKYDKLNNDYKANILESKEIKNKIVQFKSEFNNLNEEKNSEIENLKIVITENNTEKEKIMLSLISLRLKLNAVEGENRFNIKKTYNQEENVDILNHFNEMGIIIDSIYTKISEYSRKQSELEEERKIIESKLEELNRNADIKLNEFEKENRKLKEVNEEYSKKILDVVKEKTPHLIDSESKLNSSSYLKTVEIFKAYNDELSNINFLLEEKFIKAKSKMKKYKELYLSILNLSEKNKTVSVESFTPEKYKIITDKRIQNLRWLLMTPKDTNEINFSNAYWVKDDYINIDSFNKYVSENDKDKEIKDLLSIQDDLLTKLSQKEEDMMKLKSQIENLNKNKNTTNINTNTSNISKQRESSTSVDINKVETIPLEKYQKLLNTLIDEQEKMRLTSIMVEKLKSDNENLKNILDLNKSKIEKENCFSLIKDEKSGTSSNFLDNDLNEMFDNNLDRENIMGDKHNLSNISIKDPLQTPNRNTQQITSPDDEKKSSIPSSIRNKRYDTQGSLKDNTLKENLNKLEESEKLFSEQMKNIKEELKETRNQRDIYKRKFEESVTLQDGKKTEVISMLKQAFEKLVSEIQISSKVKEYLNVIFKVLDYSEDEINRIIKKTDKKGFLSLFKQK